MSEEASGSHRKPRRDCHLPRLSSLTKCKARPGLGGHSSMSESKASRSFDQQRQSQKVSTLPSRVKVAKRVITQQREPEGEAETERSLVLRRMKKFKPANGSFSKFYAEQLVLPERSNNSTLRIKIPDKGTLGSTSRELLASLRQLARTARSKGENKGSSQPLLQKEGKKEGTYLQKLREIRQTSEVLNTNSKFLLKRVNMASQQNHSSFQKLLGQSCFLLLDDEQRSVQLEQQFSKTYKKIAKQGNLRIKMRR